MNKKIVLGKINSIVENIFTVQQITEKNWELNIPAYSLFIECVKAFDKVDGKL